ncbi:MAG: hypothetical protein JRH20_21985 [Deltaproteobacteria bacterium]|nr:hypothetical protein [Deltaproteobacteria bacterium]
MLRKSKSSLMMLSTLGFVGLLFSGCVIEEGSEVGFSRADVEVRWTIEGVDSASLCSAYGIQTWIVELQGPESRTVVLDCVDNYWSSENDFLVLDEGFYTVRITALDPFDNELASVATTTDFYDLGYVDILSIDFLSRDFL